MAQGLIGGRTMKNSKTIAVRRGLGLFVSLAVVMGSPMAAGVPGAAAASGYIDTHNHAPINATCVYDDAYDADVQNDVIANMDLYGIEITLFMPPPHGVDNVPPCKYEHLAEIVDRYPARFAMLLGGESLNVMIQQVVRGEATYEEKKDEFANRALEILQAGAVGFGEFAAEHFSFHAGHPYVSASPDHPLFLDLADIGAQHDVPIDLHMEAISADIDRTQPGAMVCELAPDVCRETAENPNPQIFTENITAFKNLLNHNPSATIVWVHAGWDNTGHRTVELMSELLAAHPNLYIQLRPLRGEGRIMGCLTTAGVTTCKIRDEWVDFINAFPDRFLIGLDSFYSQFGDLPADTFLDLLARGEEFFEQLSSQFAEDVARKVAIENAVKLYKLGGQIQFSAVSYDVDEGVGEATVTVERTGFTIGSVTVDFATSDGTAKGDSQPDYTPTSGTLTFAAGETTKTFTVSITNDDAVEGNETVNLTLSNPTGGAALGSQATAVLTILNNDVAFRFVNASVTVREASGTATIAVEKLGATPGTASVQFSTSNGTATSGAGGDYIGTIGTLTFSPGDPGIKTFTVPILNDSTVESPETINLTLSNPANTAGSAALGAPSVAVLTILDDDVAFRFRSTTYSMTETGGPATIEVQRLGQTAGSASVGFATGGGTATAGVDYLATSGTLTFGPGETSKAFTVNIVHDTIPEPHETVDLLLSNPQNATGGASLDAPRTAVLTIFNDDVAFRFDGASYSVGEADGQATITVRRLGAVPPGVSVSVEYATVGGGTATAGSDYGATSGRLTFGPGQRTQTFAVTIFDDLGPESHETVNLLLRDPVNPSGTAALATPDTAVLTILNDDVVFRFGPAAYAARESEPAATVTVRRTGETPNDVSVDYAATGGTATEGSDYVLAGKTLTFTPSDSSKSFTVTLLPDTTDEGSFETVILSLSNPSNSAGTARLGAPSSASIVISDDDSSTPVITPP